MTDTGTAPSAQHSHRFWHARQRRGTGAPIAVLVLLAVVAGVVLGVEGAAHPVGLGIAVPLSALALSVVVSYFLWLDRWEPEPRRLLLLAFLWGATVAVIVSVVLELLTDEVLGDGVTLTVTGPFIEEAAKGAFLLVMLTGNRRREFDGVVDGLVYAGITAVGFAFIEDIGYIAQSFGQGTDTGVTTVVLRLVLAPFAHPLFTSLTGLGVGLAISRPRERLRWLYPVAGYLGAVGLHALWNGSLTFGLAGYLIVYVVVMVPAFGAAGLVAWRQRRRERDIVGQQLPQMVYYRWVSPAEAGWLASIGARRAWVRSVAERSGKDGVKALRGFQLAATELAFLRDRVQRGVGPPNAYQLHEELVHALLVNRAAAVTAVPINPGAAAPVGPEPPAAARPR